MSEKKATTREEMMAVEIIIGKIMRIGVFLASTVMIIGFAMLKGTSGYPGNSFPTTLSSVVSGMSALKPYAWMMGGIYLLILTPVLRVVISIYAFIKEKDYLYVKITSLVLLILIVSFFLGHR